MKYLLILILIYPSAIFSQLNIAGIVANDNHQPLPYTNIALLRKNAGTVTNKKGVFTFFNLLMDDTLKISNIAFYSRLIAVKDLVNSDTIFLTNHIQQLPGIELRNFKTYTNEKELGFFHHSSNGDFKLIPGNQIALYISNDLDKEGWIKSIDFKIKDAGKCSSIIRIRILQNDSIQFSPSFDLLSENILVQSNDLKKLNHIDLSSYRIAIPKEGIFIVVEWIYSEVICDKDSYVSVAATLTVPENIVWFNFRDKAWSKNHRPRLPNGNYMTPNIGVRVAYK